MIDLAGKLQAVFNDLRSKHGRMVLFGMFMPVSSEALWDVLASAAWLHNDLKSYGIIDDAIRARLSVAERQQISRIVILEPDSDSVVALLRELPSDSSLARLYFDFGGTRIRRAQIIHAAGTAKK